MAVKDLIDWEVCSALFAYLLYFVYSLLSSRKDLKSFWSHSLTFLSAPGKGVIYQRVEELHHKTPNTIRNSL